MFAMPSQNFDALYSQYSQPSSTSSFTPMPTSDSMPTMPEFDPEMFYKINPNLRMPLQNQIDAGYASFNMPGMPTTTTPATNASASSGSGDFDITALAKLLGGMSQPATTNISTGSRGDPGGKYDTLKVQGMQWEPRSSAFTGMNAGMNTGMPNLFKQMKGWGR